MIKLVPYKYCIDIEYQDILKNEICSCNIFYNFITNIA